MKNLSISFMIFPFKEKKSYIFTNFVNTKKINNIYRKHLCSFCFYTVVNNDYLVVYISLFFLNIPIEKNT